MKTRLDVPTLAAAAYQGLAAVSEGLAGLGLGAGFKHLLDLRVSQINHCLFCQNLHRDWGRRDGVPQERLDAVATWRDFEQFSPGERAALAWAEALTRQDESQVPALLAQLRRHWPEDVVAELTMMVAVINAWNRVGIAAYDHG